MKVAVLFLAVVGLANASVLISVPRPELFSHHGTERNLNDLLQQFIDFIPFDKCQEIVERYIATDPDVQEAYAFLLSDEFKALTDKVVAMPEYQALLKYLYDAGLDIYTYQNILRKIFGLPPIEPPRAMVHRLKLRVTESGIIKMVKEVLGALPIADIKKWFYSTCLPDPDFQALLVKLTSTEFRDLVQAIYHSQEYRDMTDILRKQGIDVDEIEKAIGDFISGQKTSKSNRNLDDLLKQFAAFIPFEDCLAIVQKYLDSDPDVKAAYAFLLSDEFKALTDKVVANPAYQDFLKYLYDAGLDIYEYQNIIRKIFGLPPINPPKILHGRSLARESGIIKMVLEILGAIPFDQIRDWFWNVCYPDPAFQALMEKILSQEFQQLVSSVINSPEYQDMISILKAQGIDVDAIEKAIDDFFNNPPSGRSARSLSSLLQEFEALIPLDDVLNIVLTYVQTDPDVMEAFGYLQGEEFRNMVVKLEGLKEMKDFLAYVYSKNIDIYNTLNTVFDILGIPEIVPSRSHFPRFRKAEEKSGVYKMVQELIGVLPIGEIADWYVSTCEPDPEFQELLEHLRGADFAVIVETIKQDPAFNTMHNGLIKYGFDVAAIEKFLHDFFQWNLP